jgi:hypothetical protein
MRDLAPDTAQGLAFRTGSRSGPHETCIPQAATLERPRLHPGFYVMAVHDAHDRHDTDRDERGATILGVVLGGLVAIIAGLALYVIWRTGGPPGTS